MHALVHFGNEGWLVSTCTWMTEEYVHTVVAGTISGAAGVLLEYPLDTIKVRLQMGGGRYTGYFNCASRMIQEEGTLSLYSGVSTRIVGSAFEHAVVFSSYKWTLRAVGTDEQHPRVWQIALGGVGGGAMSTVLLTPLELVKCRMQVANVQPGAKWRNGSVADCAASIVREGGLTALYKGGLAMLAREIPGTAAYCGTYDKLKEFLTPEGGSTANLSIWSLMFAGGCSGVAFWTIFFPADVAKTRMQVDPAFAKVGFLEALRRIYIEGGMRLLYRGWTGTAVRAFPSNALIFAVFDLTMYALTRD
ncbi:mitochondrial carnitine/acylcarnitine carrier protein [Trypanosoma brucei gambiense DAL972]|uniref:Mitochondrial carrier protein, putative n=3 Tax=Trypanosoma brucei TaxID=5691 RepID=Q57YI2_TRYB2|nr:mitochondrial carnitine/acylcarnitine carrier protein [Trypanosoma brucei gambiense DAL972]XP_847411.1 mitochondrial carrier protein, putative [Trypanosoma brucei brucei TREU927]AAX69329.1 mitochondrial carrier protein, putative [Trypanosoma brucei]RHW72956.1 mitochondrial carrier protein [Trypanosoma brucei equiperdum]AAZ13345.1 mitochondrial carrier protein, putative [Trypanosoma brucei brucei TREU927]CBH13643.1 mitochondrial carnitine/acylcarnitine carrier protein [Trypanosoma brucei gam|eukprot:XP_011775919.1 mitochondrial carnitine/acylcarnitine carrier protein [Trypanosoma brucei gambiense DAL972]